MTLKKTIEQHKYTILFCLILVFGSILRLVQLGKVPGGYQMDEAYGAFNAYSLFHSGIDSTGHSYPVYFESWGGGQNALNSYLMLPFMVFTGGKITPLVVRLPQAIVAILSLVAVYFLMKEMVNEAAGLWAMLLLSVCPWHIMMSRWGLESNLAPGFLLLGLTFFAYGLKKPRLLILSAFSYGLSLYCYATIWPIVPLLLLLEWGYGFLTKTLKIDKYFVIHVVIIGLLALPLLAFLLVNRGILPEFSIGPFSVYVMTDFRVNEIASSFRDILYNFKNLLYLLYRQDIGRPYDVIMPFGFFGITARVLIFLGVFFTGDPPDPSLTEETDNIIMDDILSTDRRIAAGITGYRGNDPDQLHLYSSCSVRSIVRVFFDRFSGEKSEFLWKNCSKHSFGSTSAGGKCTV